MPCKPHFTADSWRSGLSPCTRSTNCPRAGTSRHLRRRGTLIRANAHWRSGCHFRSLIVGRSHLLAYRAGSFLYCLEATPPSPSSEARCVVGNDTGRAFAWDADMTYVATSRECVQNADMARSRVDDDDTQIVPIRPGESSERAEEKMPSMSFIRRMCGSRLLKAGASRDENTEYSDQLAFRCPSIILTLMAVTTSRWPVFAFRSPQGLEATICRMPRHAPPTGRDWH